jgi:hypothetical protein
VAELIGVDTRLSALARAFDLLAGVSRLYRNVDKRSTRNNPTILALDLDLVAAGSKSRDDMTISADDIQHEESHIIPSR